MDAECGSRRAAAPAVGFTVALIAFVGGCYTTHSGTAPEAGMPDGSSLPITISRCPGDVPPDGLSCPKSGLVCGYGDDPRIRCRTRATCTSGGTWFVNAPHCDPPPTDGCPTDVPPESSMCDAAEGTYCDFGIEQCTCTGCYASPCSSDRRWVCESPPSDPRCPRATPNIGIPCDPDKLACLYGTCAAGTAAERDCTDSVWTDVPVTCP